MQLAVTLGALYLILGVAATGGLLVCVATLPLNLVVMRRVKVLQDRLMKEKDERMALLSEALTLTLTLTLSLTLSLSLSLSLSLTLTLASRRRRRCSRAARRAWGSTAPRCRR